MTIDQFIESKRSEMLRYLKILVRDCKGDIRRNGKALYMVDGMDEPSIDVRLCIDHRNYNGAVDGWTWIYRTGSVDYDPVHSDFCGASAIGLTSTAEGILQDLLNGIESGALGLT